MKPLMIVFLGTAFLAAAEVLLAVWLWFMIRRPVQWAVVSDRLDDWLVRIGLMSQSFAEKDKRWGRGWGRKMLIGIAGAVLLLNSGGILYIGFLILKSGRLLRW
jgi:hypothetical protein